MLNHLSRFSFCALATLALLGRLDAVDTDATASFVASCMNFDGGFGSRPGAESHAGLIYTCVGRWLLSLYYLDFYFAPFAAWQSLAIYT